MNPIFARITKVDEERREVTGRVSQETIDRDGEMMDYAASKPRFQRWSAEVFADSRGKSYGNVRSMHGNVAAGILTEIDFNDVEKSIDVTAKIVDPVEWDKVITGTYNGFSVGGRYARKWQTIEGGKPVTRFEAVPSEVSIVDRPSCPSATFFTIHKRDGSIVKREFQSRSKPMSPSMSTFLANNAAATEAMRKIHAAGATPEDPLARVRMQKMRKRNPGKQVIDFSELARSIRQMRKGAASLPPQSSNGYNDDVRSDDGATLVRAKSYLDDAMNDDDMDDDDDDMTLAVGVTNAMGSPAMRAATLSAIKRAMRNPRRMGGR